MSTRALETISRPSISEFRGDSGKSISAGSVSSSTGGRVANSEVHSIQSQRHVSLNSSPMPRNAEQAPERSQATEEPKQKASSSGLNDSLTKRSSRSSTSVASNAFKTVGKKLKLTNSTSGLQFNPGLVNLGNSCYLNSTLQGLMSTRLLENMIEFTIPPEFVGRLFPERSPALRNGRGAEYALEYAHGMELCMTFIRTLEDGWKIRNTTNAKQRMSMTPRALRNRLGMKYDQYIDFQQQDAHEFLRHLLDCMYMEEFDIIKKRQPPPPKRSHRNEASAPQPQPIPEEDRLLSFVDQVFGGQLASMLVCSGCKHVSHTYEPFMDLSLSIRGEDKDTKRNRLKSFAQRFTRQAGRAIPRPLSNPPSPRKSSVQLEPPVNVERRRSLEEVDDRPDSDPDENHVSSALAGDSETLTDGLTRLGRRVSMQLGIRKSIERSRSRSPQPAPEADPNEQKKKEQSYLGRIMADTGASRNPLELLRSGLGAGSSPNGDSITAAAASWLRLGPSHGPSLIQCMQQFTAVESLEGENKVGCSRCWKLANPSYISRRKPRESDSSSSSSDDSSSDEDEPRPSGPRQNSHTKSPEGNGDLTRATSHSRQMSQSIYQQSNRYQGPPIPSISTSSPLDTEQSNANSENLQINHNTNPSSSTASSTYLTPASSRHGSIHRTISSETGDGDTRSTTTSVSDESSSPKRLRQIKEARIPKSQRILMRAAYKRYLIAVPPPILVIHLKRFQQVSRTPIALFGSLKKIDDFIAFPEYLDMKPFIAPRKEDYGLRPTKFKNNKGAYDDQVMYRLYAVVVHIGNMLGGHYVAYTALPTPATDSPVSESGKPGESQRRWSFQSDQIVRVATLEEVLSAKAYLCFYERVYETAGTSAGGVAAPPNVQQQRKK